MSMTINTNLASMTAQVNSTKSQNDLQTAITRLSSGLRINSAKDDAAGLAIADRFTSQIRGLTQAARNANDGISLAQTAEGSLASIGDNLQRIRELAVQSANATNSASDRASLQQEVSQLVSEINRVATQTSFNGTNLLDGTFASKSFQVGANAGQTIAITSIGSARASDLGANYTASYTGGVQTGTALVAGALTINSVSIQAASAGTAAGQAATSAWATAQAINSSQGSVLATANATSVTAGGAPSTFLALAAGDLTINGVAVGAVAAGGAAPAQGANVAAAINLVSAASGVTATASAAGILTLTASDGRNIVVGNANANGLSGSGLSAATTYGTVTLSTSNTASTAIVVGGSVSGAGGIATGTTAAALTGTSLSNIDISTVGGANTALASVDAALSAISSSRASLGAIQNRFSSTIQNLQTTNENLTASRSRIQDADFAQETANLSRAQVLQQAGTAMVAQANQLPQQVLALLR
jgi:flagellin